MLNTLLLENKVSELHRPVGYPPVPGIYKNSQEYIQIAQPDSPIYLLAKDNLTHTAQKLIKNFPGEVSYAVKANPHPEILETLHSAGVDSFDVASLQEARLLRGLLPTSSLHFNNPIRTAETNREAHHELNITSFVIDDFAGLEHLIKMDTHSPLEITVRFKLPHKNAAYDFGSKFGANPETAVMLLRAVANSGHIPSMTFHPGSQCTDPAVYAEYISAAADICKLANVTLFRLNVGGGYPVRYDTEGDTPDVAAFFSTIADAVNACFPGERPALLCEPGRALVAESVSLVTQVIHVRDNGDVFINDGIYGGLQEQAITDINLPVKVWRQGCRVVNEAHETVVFGPTCDPIDRIPRPLKLPKGLQPGDFIEFGCLGAYGSATSTQFNGFESAQYEMVINGFR